MYGSISNALAGQRASKKRAEDDVKLLANRLALLKLEEKKVSVTVSILYSLFHKKLYLLHSNKGLLLQR